jgi:hypothetical protein
LVGGRVNLALSAPVRIAGCDAVSLERSGTLSRGGGVRRAMMIRVPMYSSSSSPSPSSVMEPLDLEAN